ncbi:exodeoxyribonuclease III (xth) [Spizellomyces punctatus DAOM BR117]|uniref:DNA-(apurinic or apyrimidinic site) endonuclease n=1 Tax=Spizellomyces punctatus (strain DAOM BR117) TaxID=645134 RepID=A0A0L0HUR1_SPIPD|nr:exodeoxyribonuclease III (xth) [Spizellomyces punctatus DAOM BR117]KND05071.1 exodeoxyribonuclease III (xth) [Spizellomyces punctatus DAOM BR117]|eukprot:XP_016613110.1 exodeoxyribonuclease III (xth) [Spizellomyces punctatus DAOM BR117]
MRILSWNVNSVRTLRQYHPWCEHKNYQTIIEALNADIICLQEMKITRSSTDSDLALVPGYDAFFSYPKRRHGYSGVTTYVRTDYTPIEAEEGFSGLLSKSSGIESKIGCYGQLWHEFSPAELLELDSEGRVVITDHRLFVLINIYFPVDDPSEERQAFRFKFYHAIRLRIEALIAGGRQVVIVGDVNTTHQEIDHCDPRKSMRDLGISCFHETPTRRWIHELVQPRGPMYDMFRYFHPTQEKAFTCWNTLLNARPVNYGTRIDYVLATEGLIPWMADATVEADIMGSDHCPVAVTFHDTNPVNGDCLKNVMAPPDWKPGDKRDPPRLCAKFWDEFTGKQQKLSSFFNKKSTSLSGGSTTELGETRSGGITQEERKETIIATNGKGGTLEITTPPSESCAQPSTISVAAPPAVHAQPSQSTLPARSGPSKLRAPTRKGQKSKQKAIKVGVKVPPSQGQSSISSFLLPKTTTAGTAKPIVGEPMCDATQDLPSTSLETPPSLEDAQPLFENPLACSSDPGVDLDVPTTGRLSQPTTLGTMSASPNSSTDLDQGDSTSSAGTWSTPNAASQWRSLMRPKVIPKCWHDEPAKEWVVNKTGPNQGRMFYLCARPVGPSDIGLLNFEGKSVIVPKSRRLVGEYRCDFFEWKNGPKRKGQQGGRIRSATENLNGEDTRQGEDSSLKKSRTK